MVTLDLPSLHVGDLELSLRRHNANRDAVEIGEGLLSGMAETWL